MSILRYLTITTLCLALYLAMACTASIPTATPMPTPTPTPPPIGMGISAEEVMKSYRSLGFTFERIGPSLVGTAPYTGALIALEGPPENITTAGFFLLGTISDDRTYLDLLIAFAAIVLPSWEDGQTWITNALTTVASVRESGWEERSIVTPRGHLVRYGVGESSGSGETGITLAISK